MCQNNLCYFIPTTMATSRKSGIALDRRSIALNVLLGVVLLLNTMHVKSLGNPEGAEKGRGEGSGLLQPVQLFT